MKLVSLVIPYKNAKKHIESIVKTLKGQTYENIEVIFVDDGSSDRGSYVLKSLSDGLNAKFIKSKGKGPGAARNTGILSATGEYVGFVDIDDVLHENYTSDLLSKVDGFDLAECMYKAVDLEGTVVSKTNIDSFLSPESRFTQALLGVFPRMSWGKLYRRGFLLDNDIFFPKGIDNGEDHIFVIKCYSYSPRIAIVSAYRYFWIRHSDSLTNRLPTEKTVEDFIFVSKEKIAIAGDSEVMDEDLNDKISRRFAKELRTQLREIESSGSKALIDFMVKSVLKEEILMEYLRDLRSKKLYLDVWEWLDA